MWLDEADGFAEIFKGYLPYYLLVALPIFIIMSPVNPVAASHEFSVYRMQQYDLHTVPHGCRSSSFNLEGRSLSSWSTSRHCVVARVQDVSIDQFMEVRAKAGALLLVLPKNDTVLSQEQREHIQLLEMAMIQQEMNAPTYFAQWTPALEAILEDLQHSFITDDKSGTALEAMFNGVSSNGYQIGMSTYFAQRTPALAAIFNGVSSNGYQIGESTYFAQWTPALETILEDLQHSFITDDKSGTALEAMFNGVSSNGYQIVVSAPAPQKLDSKPVTLHGKLAGRSGSAPTIVIVAHYDSNAVVPDLSRGADSNASGAVALLELARVFSRLYGNAASRGAPSLLFALAGAGHALNYFSAKRWLEEQLDSADASLLQDVSFVMCLDSISSSPSLTMHVSKPPRPGGAAHSLQSRLGVPVNHKKINLADETLAWHHERFSIRRMTAFTLSSLQSHKDPSRSSVLDTPSEAGYQHLAANVAAIARGLASHIYNLTDELNEEDKALYDEALGVDEAAIKHWYNYLSSQSRAPQTITTVPPNAGLPAALERALGRYVTVTSRAHAADRREPEYTLYGPTAATLYVYSVKPAVFDLILTLGIVAYLTVVYFAIQLFPRFYEEYARVVTGKAKVH